ncbi:MAG: hypothetical protein ROZ64_11740 [Burkholderiaceae bacterium]|jgi:hypothetical protein|nr:hypothetical protein [Burkholderiaceae bacterium]
MQEHDDLADSSCTPFAVAGAWSNAPALATLLITFAVTASVGLLVAASATPVSYPIGAILAAVLAGLGISAAGSQFVEQAAGRPVSSVARAFAATSRILLGSLLLIGVLVAVLAAFVLVSAAMLYACRLPIVGPILLLVVAPALTIGGAALLMGLAVVALLTLAALWEGHSLRTALSQLCAIAAQRDRRVLVNLFLPLLVAGALAGVGSAFVLAAFALVASLAAPLSGSIGIEDWLASLAAGPALVGDATAMTAWAGVAILATILLALWASIFLFAMAIGYRRCVDGIDIAMARAAVSRAIVEFQVRKGETIEELAAFVRRAFGSFAPKPESGAPVLIASSPAAAMATPGFAEQQGSLITCAHCASSAQPDDVYCGNCGQRLSPPLVA